MPVFFAEVLADLRKPANKGRTAEEVVGSIAAKISGFSALPNMHHLTLCIGDLLGHPVDAHGVPVVGSGKIVRSAAGKTGLFFDEPPETAAMRRWSDGDFLGVERDFAKGWRDGLEHQELPALAAAIRPPGKSPLRTLAELRAAADDVASGRRGKRYRSLKLALAMLLIPLPLHAPIIARWKACGGPPLSAFAPTPITSFASIYSLISVWRPGSSPRPDPRTWASLSSALIKAVWAACSAYP